MKMAHLAMAVTSMLFVFTAISMGLSILAVFFSYISGISTGVLIWELTKEDKE